MNKTITDFFILVAASFFSGYVYQKRKEYIEAEERINNQLVSGNTEKRKDEVIEGVVDAGTPILSYKNGFIGELPGPSKIKLVLPRGRRRNWTPEQIEDHRNNRKRKFMEKIKNRH